MARTYRRDARGRFSGGGGSSGGSKGNGSKAAPKSKGAMTKAADKARAADLKAKGTTGLGSRVKAKGFAGKKAKDTAGGLRSEGMASTRIKAARPGTVAADAGKRSKQTAIAAKSKQRAAGRAASKGTKKMAPAPANPAKEKYQELRAASRKSNVYATANENKKAAGAKRSLKNFIAKRGVSKRKK
jgi:hypothetical protein